MKLKFIVLLGLVLINISSAHSAEIIDSHSKWSKPVHVFPEVYGGWATNTYWGSVWKTDVNSAYAAVVSIQTSAFLINHDPNIKELSHDNCDGTYFRIQFFQMGLKEGAEMPMETKFKVDNSSPVTLELTYKNEHVQSDGKINLRVVSEDINSLDLPRGLKGKQMVLSLPKLGISEVIPLDGFDAVRNACKSLKLD